MHCNWTGPTLIFLARVKRNAYYTAWCSEIGPLRSLDAPELHASRDVREPISLHQAVHVMMMIDSNDRRRIEAKK